MEAEKNAKDAKLLQLSKPQEEPYITFDDLLQKIGPFGPAQLKVYILTSLFDFALAVILMFFLFGGGNPGWYCIPPHQDSLNLTSSFLVNETRSTGFLAGEVTTSYLVREDWADVCSVNGSKCERFVFKPGHTTIVTEFSLVCDLDYVSTFCTTMAMLGILFGAGISGQLTDIFGRRPVFFSFAFLMILCQLCQSFAANWQMFAGFRFFSGLLAGGFMVVTYIIPLEVVGHQWRTVCGCIGFWQLGQMAFAGLGTIIPDWRNLSFASAVIFSPLLLTWFFIPESPRWLIQKNKMEAAHKVLVGMAKLNGKTPPSVACVHHVLKQKTEDQKFSFWDLFRDRLYTTRALTVFFLWFSCTMTYYGLSLNGRDISDNVSLNVFIMGAAELCISVSVIFSAKHFGRRPALLFYFILTSCCLLTALGLNFTESSPLAQSLMSALGRAALSGGWAVAYLLSAELFPTVIRALACGSCSIAGRFGGILAPQVAYLKVVHRIIPGLIYTSFAISATIVAFCVLPETKGKSLPDQLRPRIGCCSAPTEGDCFTEYQLEEKDEEAATCCDPTSV